MTTDPREIPQTREEKLAATSTMYDTSKIIAERDARDIYAAAKAKRDADPAYEVVAARAMSGAKIHAMYLGNRILFCRGNVAGMGYRLNGVEVSAVDCKNCAVHVENEA
jgi:hypothetical protein